MGVKGSVQQRREIHAELSQLEADNSIVDSRLAWRSWSGARNLHPQRNHLAKDPVGRGAGNGEGSAKKKRTHVSRKLASNQFLGCRAPFSFGSPCRLSPIRHWLWVNRRGGTGERGAGSCRGWQCGTLYVGSHRRCDWRMGRSCDQPATFETGGRRRPATSKSYDPVAASHAHAATPQRCLRAPCPAVHLRTAEGEDNEARTGHAA
jgi:hypothetical protein